MRTIEEKMLRAINLGKNWKNGNTEVCHLAIGGQVLVRLHDNLIAVRDKDGAWHYNNCGWATTTTKSRLNALGANINQKDWAWYQGDKPFVNEDLYRLF